MYCTTGVSGLPGLGGGEAVWHLIGCGDGEEMRESSPGEAAWQGGEGELPGQGGEGELPGHGEGVFIAPVPAK